MTRDQQLMATSKWTLKSSGKQFSVTFQACIFKYRKPCVTSLTMTMSACNTETLSVCTRLINLPRSSAAPSPRYKWSNVSIG